jgi:predicted DNA-binding ribbon-helix-helix protein
MEGVMNSPVVKRSIIIAGHKTSVSIEDAFWKGLKEIAMGRDLTLSEMVSAIDSERAQANLSSALRLFVLNHYRAQTIKRRMSEHCSLNHAGLPEFNVQARVSS